MMQPLARKEKGRPTEPALLREVPLFASLSDAELAIVGQYLSGWHVSRNTAVLVEGETGDELFVLVKGEVEVSQNLVLAGARGQIESRDKVHTRLNADRRPFFGEVALVTSQPRTVDRRAVEALACEGAFPGRWGMMPASSPRRLRNAGRSVRRSRSGCARRP